MEQGPDPQRPSEERDSALWVVLGVGLILAGFFYGARALDIVPWPIGEMFHYAGKARTGIGVLLVGVAVLLWARSDRHFNTPAKGTKLYRSRDEKWVSGVLGGLSEYFGVDVTLLRLAFIALVVLLDVGSLVVAYIIMAIVVPLEPVAAAAQPPAPPLPPA